MAVRYNSFIPCNSICKRKSIAAQRYMVPGGAQCCPVQPGGAHCCQVVPTAQCRIGMCGARWCLLPTGARCCLLSGSARWCSLLVAPATCCCPLSSGEWCMVVPIAQWSLEGPGSVHCWYYLVVTAALYLLVPTGAHCILLTGA